MRLLLLLALGAALCAGCDGPPDAPAALRAHCAEWAKAEYATRCDPHPNTLPLLAERCRETYGYR